MKKGQEEFFEFEPSEWRPFGRRDGYVHFRLEDFMKSGSRDKTEGMFHEVKGQVKEVAGKITDNPKLETEGKAEKIAGKVQGKLGQVKKVFGQ